MRVYACNSCGGEILADETTAATTCPYCDSTVVMKGQLAGDLRPDYLIPFCITKEQAMDIVNNGFEGKEDLLAVLRNRVPHMGSDNDEVDALAVRLMNAFSDAVAPLRSERGGCVRAGTGSAMFYLWSAAEIGATLSGHRPGDAFSANYSPELFVRNNGPLSVIRSFTKPDLQKVINGGPLTLEFHATIFRDPDSIRKVALLVQSFIKLGGHQLQLNSVDPAILKAAQEHPEDYRSLIVRIWGWSAYFVELDKEYQDHVISRQSYTV
jgi:formate C-acetyltransferase